MNCQVGYSPDSQSPFAGFLQEFSLTEDNERIRAFLCRRPPCAFNCGSELFPDLCHDRYNL